MKEIQELYIMAWILNVPQNIMGTKAWSQPMVLLGVAIWMWGPVAGSEVTGCALEENIGMLALASLSLLPVAMSSFATPHSHTKMFCVAIGLKQES